MFDERQADGWLRALAGREPLPPAQPDAPLRLIPLRVLAERRGRCKRSIKREIEKTYGKLDGARTDGALAKRSLESV